MSAIFALALFLSFPARAGVVASVESAVAPSAPTAILPVAAPTGSGFAGAILGGADLRGSIPLLPAPVPGLAPALNFVGESFQPAVAPEAAPAAPAAKAKPSPAPAPARAVAVNGADRTPAIPAKTAPGSSLPAFARDRDGAKNVPDSTPAALRDRAGDAARPLSDTAALEHALPETSAGAARRFFDQSRDAGRGTVSGPGDSKRESAGVEKSLVESGAGSGDAGRSSRSASGGFALRPSASGSAASGSRGLVRDSAVSPEGEELRDAVAGAPFAAAPGGAVSFFRSASPNGELAPGRAGAALPAGASPAPLSLDLSGSGLIVRVRAALGAASPATASAELPVRALPAASASTAMLERGAMLEAFSVAGAYAGELSGTARSAVVAAPSAARAIPSPKRGASSVPPAGWWALLLLPALGLGARRFL